MSTEEIKPEDLVIGRFDFSKLPKYGVIFVTGKTGSGKTVVTKEILYHKRHYDQYIALLGSEGAREVFRRHMPEAFFFEGFDEKALQRIVKHQKLQRRLGQAQDMVIVIDDCTYDNKRMKKSEVLKEIFMNGRHMKILLILTAQWLLAIQPEMRSQVKVVICCRETNPEYRQRVYKYYSNGCVQKWGIFDQIMMKCTEDYKVMVLLNEFRQNPRIPDMIFYARAEPKRKFKCGEHSWIWDFHEQNFDPLWFLREEDEATQRQYEVQLVGEKRKRGHYDDGDGDGDDNDNDTEYTIGGDLFSTKHKKKKKKKKKHKHKHKRRKKKNT